MRQAPDQIRKKFGIGLTGGLASGKSTVGRILAENGFIVIDADILAREAVLPGSPLLAEIEEQFGSEFINPDGELNRKALAQNTFQSPERTQKLNQMTHPHIAEIQEKKMAELGLLDNPRFWFYEASLLFENGSWPQYREIWTCVCSPEEQLRRATALRNIDRETAQNIIKLQMPLAEKALKSQRVINTEVPLSELKTSIAKELENLRGGQNS